MSGYDYISVARELCAMLREHGYLDRADEMRFAIESGSTGTEIIMGIKYNVEIILQINELDEIIRKTAVELHHNIIRIIGR